MKILKFYAPWCGQCKILAKEFERNIITVPIENINADDEDDLVDKYNIRSLPTTILIDNNSKELFRWYGFIKSEDINNKINECR